MSSAFEGLPKTPNLSLNKPGYDNVADIEALNENADILDEEINTLKINLKNKGSATEPVYFDSNGVPQKTKNFNDYLPLSGGNMTDTVISRSVNDSLLALIGGTNGDNGATLMLYGKDNSSGRFLIRANNGTEKIDLVGTAAGGLTWNNKEIFHSGKVIPIANGGTGASSASNARTNLGLGSVATENTVPISKGGTGATTAIQACANIGASNQDLSNISTIGRDNVVSWCIPDYSAGITLTMSTSEITFTAPKNGIIVGTMDNSGITSNLKINGIIYQQINPWASNMFIIVSKNDVISYYTQNTSSRESFLVFYPLKGVNN